jgi:hypothetical protein
MSAALAMTMATMFTCLFDMPSSLAMAEIRPEHRPNKDLSHPR